MRLGTIGVFLVKAKFTYLSYRFPLRAAFGGLQVIVCDGVLAYSD